MGQNQSQKFHCNTTTTTTQRDPMRLQEATRDASECELDSSRPQLRNTVARDQTSGRDLSRKLSIISNRNIQLLSMRPRSEMAAFADDLCQRRRSSLINLILGAPSRGPRFSDDLCSINSHLSDCNFGIEFFPAPELLAGSLASSLAKLDGQQVEQTDRGPAGSIWTSLASGQQPARQPQSRRPNCDPMSPERSSSSLARQTFSRHQLVSTLASIDLASSFDEHDKSGPVMGFNGTTSGTNGGLPSRRPPLVRAKRTILETVGSCSNNNNNKGTGVNHTESINAALRRLAGHRAATRGLRRAGSELSLYSNLSNTSDTQLASNSGPNKTGSNNNSNSNNNNNNNNRNSLFEGRTRSSSTSSATSAGVAISGRKCSNPGHQGATKLARETRLIIILQVCLPFILAGFGNMAAGLVLNKVANWRAFRLIPSFFVLLPPFIGFKGNIEMTLASRLSTLSNLNLIKTATHRRRAYLSNLTLIMSQAIGLGLFAAIISVFCELAMGGLRLDTWAIPYDVTLAGESHTNHSLAATTTTTTTSAPKTSTHQQSPVPIQVAVGVIIASTLTTAIITVLISSIMMPSAILLANFIQVNPDNLSTLIAALYGDVSCVLIYGLVADRMFANSETGDLTIPLVIVSLTILLWPILLFMAYKMKETNSIALASLPPMLTSIMISICSGAILSLFINRFKLIALYQPVVNGFGANLIAVQASRVSTWLWCGALRKMSMGTNDPKRPPEASKKLYGSLVSFTPPSESVLNEKSQTNCLEAIVKCLKTLFWSFCNSSPNAVAAKLLLLMLIPAHTLYFFVIWLLSDPGYVVITLPFYLGYITLCIIQVTTLLTICEPFMTLLMNKGYDPDIFGISILMALADLIGTVCLVTVFLMLAKVHDVNAT